MADEFQFRVDTSGVLRTLRRLPDQLHKELHKAVKVTLQRFERHFVTKHLSKRGTRFGKGGSSHRRMRFLFRRTGSAARGITRRVHKGKGIEDVSGKVGWIDRKLAARMWVHERGALIRRRRRYLTVPLSGALTSSGVTRAPARMWENTFVRRGASGNLIIFQRAKTRGGKPKPLFALLDRVRIPPRLMFRRTFFSWFNRGPGGREMEQVLRKAMGGS